MPPPPPPGPPLPPGPPPPPGGGPLGGKAGKSKSAEPDRTQLLASIRTGTRLKKVETNDRSAPVLDNKPKPSTNSTPSPSASAGMPKGPATATSPAQQLGGLFAGGMPKLRPTGSRGLAPTPKQENGSFDQTDNTREVSPGRQFQSKTMPAAPKPFINGSGVTNRTNAQTIPANKLNKQTAPAPPAFTRKPSLEQLLNRNADRGPPPQPPKSSPPTPTTNGPTSGMGTVRSKTGPPLPTKPPVSTKPIIPRKPSQDDLSINGTPTSFLNQHRPSDSQVPSDRKPQMARQTSVGRAQSLRQMSRQTSEDTSSETSGETSPVKSVRTVNSSSKFGTLPRSAFQLNPAPPPPVQRSPGAVVKHPTAKPPPPPQRIVPPSVAPPPPPSSAPPPPPHRTGPAPPPPRLPATFVPPAPTQLPPAPPTRNSSMRSNSSSTSLNSTTVATKDDFESLFAGRFRPVNILPAPDQFTNCNKVYPSKNVQQMQQSMKRTPAPPPPPPPPFLGQTQIRSKLIVNASSVC